MAKSQNIFIKLRTQKIGVKKLLSSGGLEDDIKMYYEDKLKFIELLEEFKLEMSWLIKKNSKERMSIYFKCNHDIKRTLELLPELEKNPLQTSIWYASTKFAEAIGKNTVRYIEEDRLDEAKMLFRLTTGDLSLDMVIPKGIVDMLPQPSKDDHFYMVTECIRELKFLEQISIQKVQSILSRVDEDKMSFLRHVIESDDIVYTQHREIIYKLLEGDSTMSFDEAVEELKLLE